MANLNLDIALTDAGFNQRTKRYGFARDPVTNEVIFDDTQTFAVLSAAICRRRRWPANPNFGSEIHSLKTLTRRSPANTTSQAVAMTKDAEKANVDAGLILEPEITAEAGNSDLGGGRVLVTISYTTPAGVRNTVRVAG